MSLRWNNTVNDPTDLAVNIATKAGLVPTGTTCSALYSVNVDCRGVFVGDPEIDGAWRLLAVYERASIVTENL